MTPGGPDRGQDLRRRRFALMHELALKVNRGELAPQQAHAQLQRAGFVPGGSAHKQPHGLPLLLAKTAGDIGTVARFGPEGIYEFGKAVALDERDAVTGRTAKWRKEHPDERYPFRTKKYARAVGHELAQDVRHPLRHPGYTLLDALLVGGVAANSAGRLGRASMAFRKAAEEPREPLASVAGRALTPKVSARVARPVKAFVEPGNPYQLDRAKRRRVPTPRSLPIVGRVFRGPYAALEALRSGNARMEQGARAAR